MTVQGIVTLSHRLLGSIVEPLRGNLGSELTQQGFVLAHAELIWDLSWDLFQAGTEGAGRASRVLLRSMLESLFNLKAAAKNEAFHYAKVVDEAVKYKQALTGAAKQSNQRQQAIVAINQFISRFRRKPGVRQIDVTSIAKIARLADMEDHYRGNYAFYCMFTHPSLLGLSLDDGCFQRGDICQEVVFILLEASIFASHELLPPVAPEYEKQAHKLGDKSKAMIAKGIFEKLNERPHPTPHEHPTPQDHRRRGLHPGA
jgi:hypothetical protein